MVIEGAAVAAWVVAIVVVGLWIDALRRLRRNRRWLAASERRGAETAAAARQSGEEVLCLRATLDALPLPVWRRDRTNAVVGGNRAFAAALGDDDGIKLAENPGPAALGEGQELCLCDSAGAASRETHVVIAGQRRLLAVKEVRSAAGGAVGFALDRSDLEAAQRDLRRHIAAHAAVLECLSAAVAIFGPDKKLKFFNVAFARLWALDEFWLATEPTFGEVLDHLHASRRLPEYPDFRAFKRERCAMFTSLIEARHDLFHLPDGRTLQVTAAPHPLGGVTIVYDDVSDRLALECSYNTLAQVQRATLDHLFEGIAVFGGDGRLKLHNPAFRSLWGLSEEDVAGEPHIAAIIDKTRALLDDGGNWAALRERMAAQITSQTMASGPLYRRDGSVLQVGSVPLPDGEVLATYIDVSDAARIEQALRERNEALETAGRLKTEFVANLSHELRTPLNTIIGFAEILHHEYFGSLNPSQREYSGGVLDGAHQLMTLIDDVIDLSTIEAGYLELERHPVDVFEVLRGVTSLTRERAASRELSLELRCAPQIGVIDGDERRLKQALFNLISNAIKFTPPGGAIRIEAERAEGELLLRVADTGVAIATAEHAWIPAGYEHSDHCRTGTGLGLALVRSLIELHGGSVEIDSGPGRETRVTCRLPVPGCDRIPVASAKDATRPLFLHSATEGTIAA